MPSWVRSASDHAKKVPRPLEEVAFGAFWAPGRLPWRSQGLTMPKKVCRFPKFVCKIQSKSIPQKQFCL